MQARFKHCKNKFLKVFKVGSTQYKIIFPAMTYQLLLPCLSELAVEACSGSCSAVGEVGDVLPEWVEHFRWNAFSRPFDAPSEGVAQSICPGQPKEKENK